MRRGRGPGRCGGGWQAPGVFPERTRSRTPPAARGVRRPLRSTRGRAAARLAARGRGYGEPCRRRSAKWGPRGPPWAVGPPTAGPRGLSTRRPARSAGAHRRRRIPRRARARRCRVWRAGPGYHRASGCPGPVRGRARVSGRSWLRVPRVGPVCRPRAYWRCGPGAWGPRRCRCRVWLAGRGCLGPVWARELGSCWSRAPRAVPACWARAYWRCGPGAWGPRRCRCRVWLVGRGCLGPVWARELGLRWSRAPRVGRVCRPRAYRRCGPGVWGRRRCGSCVWLAGRGCLDPARARELRPRWSRAPRAVPVCRPRAYWRCGLGVWGSRRCRCRVWLAGPGCLDPVWARVSGWRWSRVPRVGPACRARAYRRRGPGTWTRRCRARLRLAAPAYRTAYRLAPPVPHRRRTGVRCPAPGRRMPVGHPERARAPGCAWTPPAVPEERPGTAVRRLSWAGAAEVRRAAPGRRDPLGRRPPTWAPFRRTPAGSRWSGGSRAGTGAARLTPRMEPWSVLAAGAARRAVPASPGPRARTGPAVCSPAPRTTGPEPPRWHAPPAAPAAWPWTPAAVPVPTRPGVPGGFAAAPPRRRSGSAPPNPWERWGRRSRRSPPVSRAGARPASAGRLVGPAGAPGGWRTAGGPVCRRRPTAGCRRPPGSVPPETARS